MMLSVLGLGLVSPTGASARDHAFFSRAGAPPPWSSPFVLADDTTLDVGYCPWIEPLGDAPKRIAALAASALDEAMQPLAALELADGDRSRLLLMLCTPEPRPDLPEPAIAAIAAWLARRASATAVLRWTGAAGAFVALERLEQLLAGGEASAAVIVGVDSAVSMPVLTRRALFPPNPWLLQPPRPSEGAGAVLVSAPAVAARCRIAPIGTITEVRHGVAKANDHNDDWIDARGLTDLLTSLPRGASAGSVFGQARVDELRCREWEWSAARQSERFASLAYADCLEASVGSVGAAAGAMNLAMCFASLRHGITPTSTLAPSSALVWAISADGTRGLALGSASLASRELIALSGACRAREVAREPLASTAAPEGDQRADGFEDAEDDVSSIDALEGEPANDLAPAFPPLPTAVGGMPPVRLDTSRARSFGVTDLHREVVRSCIEIAAQLGRDRLQSPWRSVAEIEQRLLWQLDAIVAAGPRALGEVFASWREGSDDPSRSFACVLAMLAFAGDDAARGVVDAVGELPEDGHEQAMAMATALVLSDHPALLALGRTLAKSPQPLARAAGIALLGTRGQLSSEQLATALTDMHEAVVRAATWAMEPLPPDRRGPHLDALRAHSVGSKPAVAWSAGRVLLVWGDPVARQELRSGSLSAAAGPHALDLLALAGSRADRRHVEAALVGMPMTAGRLPALGRLGDLAFAERLIQHLADPDLGDDAANALETMLGARVERSRRLEASLWRSALAAMSLDPTVRVRRGLPWSPAIAADECASGALSRMDVERRIDEIHARGPGAREHVDVSGWWPHASPRLTAFLDRARRS